MLTLAFSAFLIGSGLIVIPIILHLLRLKPRIPQAYPALQFLHVTVAKRQNRNRLQKFIVLLLRCLIFLLIALAFAWPYLAKINQEPINATVLLWDNSFSTQATSVNSYLNDAALKLLMGVNRQYPLVVGSVGETVQWSGEFSSDEAKLMQWFKAHSRASGSSSFREALRVADSRLKTIAAQQKTITIITDRQWLPWENVELKRSLAAGTELKLIMPPKADAIKNCAVTYAEIQTKYFAPKQSLKLKIACQNFNKQPAKAHLIIYWDSKKVVDRELTIAAQTTVNEFVQLTSPNESPRPVAGRVELKVAGDELAIDNRRYFSVNPIEKPQLFFTPLSGRAKVDFIKVALTATPEKTAVAAQFHQLTPATALKDFKAANLLVLQDIKPFGNNLAEQLDKYLTGGGNIVIVWNRSPEIKKLLRHFAITVIKPETRGVKRFEMLDFEHPILKDYMQVRAGEWFDILFFDVPTLKFPAKTKIIAYFDNQIPAITEARYKNGKLFIIAAQLDRKHTNWPTFGSFLPFWRELLLYTERQSATDYSLTVTHGKKVWTDKVTVRSLTAAQSVARTFLPLNQPAVFMVKKLGQQQLYTVNIPAKESAIVRMPEHYDYQQLVSKHQAAPQVKAKNIQQNQLTAIQHAKNYWWILLAIAFMLSFVEITLANRTAL
jgi:hypothetical protein